MIPSIIHIFLTTLCQKLRKMAGRSIQPDVVCWPLNMISPLTRLHQVCTLSTITFTIVFMANQLICSHLPPLATGSVGSPKNQSIWVSILIILIILIIFIHFCSYMFFNVYSEALGPFLAKMFDMLIWDSNHDGASAD